MNRVLTPRNGSKTVVVLLGWLGAQPKSLRRYEALYRTLLPVSGSEDVPASTTVIQTYIAPPFTIVQSVLDDEAIRVPFEWPLRHSYCHSIRTVQDLAWNILQDIHDKTQHHDNSNSHIYIHTFSNGGCFVWEKIRQLLLMKPVAGDGNQIDSNNTSSTYSECTDPVVCIPPTTLSDVQSRVLLQIRQQLRGVVFDSCPIRDLHRLSEALQYCTIAERIQVLRFCHFKYLFMNTDPKVKEQVQHRITNYVNGLKNDPLDIKQLYLYSRDDPLAPAPFIDELVQYRRCMRRRRHHDPMREIKHNSRDADIDDESIMSCVWDKSQHCGHHIHHPKDYTNALETFLMKHHCRNETNTTTNNDKLNVLRSKL